MTKRGLPQGGSITPSRFMLPGRLTPKGGGDPQPYAEQECKVMLVEPKGVVNTGENSGDLTAQNDVWI